MTTTLKLISLKVVLERVPLSKSELYRRINAGSFPPQVRLGPNRIAFVASEVDAWASSMALARGTTGGSDAEAV